ncbi:septation protein A [Lichenifustis flavocetrariae]|uniref:Inner membrane-spanning protein YciB n=1 Tax=Lichenifustis flavocetrariae TaxID=2949735 RepID=A0AA41YWR0_9HYPH|nr:septation protein A [Lichenifustis flavocetrariae]MCW6508666.1 septation protein A [Lichenifustis flavocetrariae]
MTDTKPEAAKSIPAGAPAPRKLDPTLKLLLEFGPLGLFFIASYRYNLHVATGVLMAGVLVTLAVSYAIVRRVPIMPLVTAVAVLVFGALTFYFDNPIFIKVKPTIVNCIFGTVLLGGLLFNRSLLSVLLDTALSLDETGWRKLTLRWGIFFFFLAALNEVVWRTQSDVFWAGFKVFGTMPITVVFALCQVPLILKHELKNPEATPDHF